MTNHWHGIIPSSNLDDGIEPDFTSERDPSFDVVDRTAWNADGAQHTEPFVGCPRAQSFNQQRAKGIAVAGAIFGVRKPGIMRQLREIEDLAEVAELPIVPGSDNKAQIRCGWRCVGEQAGVDLAPPGRPAETD